MPAAKKTAKPSKKTATTPAPIAPIVLGTFTIATYECSHEGDIERDLNDLREAGLEIRRVLAMEDFNGSFEVEEGCAVFTSYQDEATIRAIIAKADACINGLYVGDEREKLRGAAEAESYDRADEERRDEEDEDDDC